ncbi:ATP-binding protein [Chloroflexota bacterium]
MSQMPVIDVVKCNGCGLCLSVCSCGALLMVNNVITIVEVKECIWCTECEAVCPTGAISCPFEIIIEDN